MASYAAAAEENQQTGRPRIKIVGVCCSLRKGKTTAAAMQVCLEAARAVASEQIAIELIELAGLSIPAGPAAGIPLEPGQRDDFPQVEAKIADAAVAGLVVGTPVYFSNMSSLCKVFLERCCMALRKEFGLANRVAGVLAVGGSRNGGQELSIRSVHSALISQQMIVVGDAPPTSHWGATLWNNANDDIVQDKTGLSMAQNLGRRVAEVALALRGVASAQGK